jgi:hypothetical protein
MDTILFLFAVSLCADLDDNQQGDEALVAPALLLYDDLDFQIMRFMLTSMNF